MQVTWDLVRDELIGSDTDIATPYGLRRVTYADYTASGRGIGFIERYMSRVLESYANTHTEDDTTGLLTSKRLAAAERSIKHHLNADSGYKLIAVGAGATAAINRLQEILGVYIPPATRERVDAMTRSVAGDRNGLLDTIRDERAVVFVGPYEHHSNEISWREGIAEVVEIELDDAGRLDLEDLESKLRRPEYRGRKLIGSFSAASNVSGIKTPVYAVAALLHQYGALAFFDFSASAPYVAIDMQRDAKSYFDGVFFSPHKFVGGPGSAGLLVVREEIYPSHLPPSESGGGTVTFVSPDAHDYVTDIEEREKPGTPAILQTIRAALALDLQRQLGITEIEERETTLLDRALSRFRNNSSVEVLSDAPATDRVAIFAFNVRSGSGYLHPRFVVRLLNDLFGIQSRAGCSCAGPYGHRLLKIDQVTSSQYRRLINAGHEGVKPGWVRLNFHYLITDEEFAFLCDAIDFVAEFGRFFLLEYTFNIETGGWAHRHQREESVSISAADAAELARRSLDGQDGRSNRKPSGSFREYLQFAEARARDLAERFDPADVRGTTDPSTSSEEGLIPYWYVR